MAAMHHRLMAPLAACLTTVVLGTASSGSAANELRIGVVTDQAPCSDVVRNVYRGSAVDLWHQVAERAGLAYRFSALPSMNDAIEAAAEGRIDLAVSCLSITPDRLEDVTFTTPYAEDGLSILTKRQPYNIINVASQLSSNSIIRDSSLLLILSGLAFGVILWIASREFSHKDIDGGNKFNTFYKGMVMLIIGSGIYKMGAKPLSMSIIALNNFSRLVITSIFVGTATSLLIKSATPSDISDQDVLKSIIAKKIAVDQDTVSQLWLNKTAEALYSPAEREKLIFAMKNSQELLNSLEQGTVGGILANSATIKKLLGQQLQRPENYEILGKTYYNTPQAFAIGRDLDATTLKSINIAIADLKFEGEVDRILKRWDSASSAK